MEKERTYWNSTIKIKKPLKRAYKRKVKPLKKRIKLPSIPSLVKKADIVFAKYIRERDGNRCVLCGSTKNPTCGHLVKRGKKTTRYSEINCHCLCMACNYKDNFEHDHYVVYFLNKYGEGKYKLLIEYSKEFHKWTREELYQIISKYANH